MLHVAIALHRVPMCQGCGNCDVYFGKKGHYYEMSHCKIFFLLQFLIRNLEALVASVLDLLLEVLLGRHLGSFYL